MASRRLEWILTGTAGASRPEPPERTELDARFFRAWVAPAGLVLATPPLVVVLWMTCAHFDGSIVEFATTVTAARFWQLFPRPTARAAAILMGWFVAQGMLLAFLPGTKHLGPPTPTGQQPTYRSNGVSAWFVTHGSLLAGWRLGLWSPATLYRELGPMLVILNASALAFCVFLYWKGRYYPSSTDAVWTRQWAFDFFQGTELHPTLFGINLKQLVNCRISMMGWSVLLASFAGAQYEIEGRLSSGMAVSAGLLVAYLFKFFWWERGYFHTLDIMHDRFGYYICWGVLVWVPSVYTVFGQYLVNHPKDLGPAWTAVLVGAGLLALWINYAADEQRQRVRDTNGLTTIWGKPPRLLHAKYRTTDGKERENLLLASGYWGLARHFHYVPELMMALCWALPTGTDAFLPYFYFVFLTILLVDRANRDDKRCRDKYGATWEEYCRRVPKKIVPGLY